MNFIILILRNVLEDCPKVCFWLYRKLRDAKEKLKQLQDLVSAVQQAPDAVRALSDSVAEGTMTQDNRGQAPLDNHVSLGEKTRCDEATK